MSPWQRNLSLCERKNGNFALCSLHARPFGGIEASGISAAAAAHGTRRSIERAQGTCFLFGPPMRTTMLLHTLSTTSSSILPGSFFLLVSSGNSYTASDDYEHSSRPLPGPIGPRVGRREAEACECGCQGSDTAAITYWHTHCQDLLY